MVTAVVIVWGEVLWDRFPDGAQLGGAPANVAWHLAQLGTPVALVTRVGDDADGHAAIAALAARGVDTRLIQIDGERATGEVTVAVEHGEPRYQLIGGRAWERIALTDDVADALVAARAIVFGTLAQRTDDGHAGLAAALELASPRVLRVCDPNLRNTSPTANGPPADALEARQRGARADQHLWHLRALEQALAAADVVKVGEREVAQIAAHTDRADPVAWLLERGARLVAVTRGADGSRWHAPDFAGLDIAAVPARAGGNNVGCGDAYTAALVHGLLAGWPWPRIGRLASLLGGEVAGHRGATPILDAARIAALIAEAT